MGIDPDIQFNKDRFMRMMITGGVVSGNAISAMRSFDIAKERELENEAKRKRR